MFGAAHPQMAPESQLRAYDSRQALSANLLSKFCTQRVQCGSRINTAAIKGSRSLYSLQQHPHFQSNSGAFMMLFISLNNNSVVLSIYPSLYRCKCLSLRPSIHSSIHPSIHYYSIHPFISQSIHCSIYLSFCSSLYRSFFPSVFLYVHSSIYRSIYRSIYLSFYLSFCRSIYHSIIMYACLSIHSFIHSSHRLWFIITFHSSIHHFNSLSLHSNLNHN